MRIKIGTYNVCHCGDYANRKDGDPTFVIDINMPATAQTIKELGLDLIGINEFYDDGNIPDRCKQAEKVASLSGYEYSVFAKGQTYDFVTIGNGMLSHYPLTNIEKITVPTIDEDEREDKDAWWEDRVLLVADVDFNGKMVKVIESHFGCNLSEREKIVKVACDIIDKSEYPVVLMGDFNAFPTDAELKPLYDRLNSCAMVTGNTDFTFASYDPKIHIDYIFVPKTAKVISYKVHNYKTSDHFPISAEIEL